MFLRRLARTATTIGITVALVAGGWWMLTQAHKSGDASTVAAHGNEPEAPVAITVAAVEPRRVQRTVEAVGTLHAFERVMISAKVEGRVKAIHHDMADRVAPDEVLLEIDPTDYDLAVRQAEKSLSVELARLGLFEMPKTEFEATKVPSVSQAAARLANAKLRLERSRGLAQRQAGTEEDLAERSSELRVAQAEYDNQVLIAQAGWANVHLKLESLAIARQQRRDTVVRVPKPTTAAASRGARYAIAARSVAEGTFVRVGDAMFDLVIDETLKLRVPVPEKNSGAVRVGQQVEVTAAAYDERFAGEVTRVNPVVDAATRTFDVEIRIANADARLKPGSFAKAAILTHIEPQAPTVPLEAVVRFAGVTKVFLADGGRAKAVNVELGVQTSDWVEIAEPALPRGAHVVTSGQTALAADTPVAIRHTAGSPNGAAVNTAATTHSTDEEAAEPRAARRSPLKEAAR